MTGRRFIRRGPVFVTLALALVAMVASGVRADEPQRQSIDLLISTHTRLSFERDVSRVAVADEAILSVETLTSREVLVLGKQAGRTTLIVWFADNGTDSYMFQVKRDLSLLEDALKDIHPSIQVVAAPDRDAVVLRGLVPDITYSNAAEEAAQRYLDARRRAGTGTTPAVLPGRPGETPPAVAVQSVEQIADVAPSSMVINLIRVEMLPGRLEDRMKEAIEGMNVPGVTVRRLVRGRLPDDEEDIFVLEGSVDTQITLIRVLSLAQSLVGEAREEDIKVLADESGALASQRGGSNQVLQGSRSLTNIFGGSTNRSALENSIESNLGRAKVVEAGNGRILSFIDVVDQPQVRVDIRLYEVNTSKIREYDSDWALLLSNFTQGSFTPAGIASATQGVGASRVGAQGENPDVQNVLGFLAGNLSNQFQLAGDNVAVDSVLSLLEQQGWARSLSRPSLTVLSGEVAFFQVGGQIPVQENLLTSVETAGSVFNTVTFKDFGVQLGVRPLVSDRSSLVLDVAPEISIPDPELTDAIRDSTGSSQATTSFRTRYLQTTARLDDGQALMIGGLLSRNQSSTNQSTPGISDLPLVGGLFTNEDRNGDEIQLVIVLHPVVLREPRNDARMWAFPDVPELMRSVWVPTGAQVACPPPRGVIRRAPSTSYSTTPTYAPTTRCAPGMPCATPVTRRVVRPAAPQPSTTPAVGTVVHRQVVSGPHPAR